MAEEKSATVYRDMLDIIFANRNKAYGAYKLRREYPKYLTRAFLLAIGLVVVVFAAPIIMQAVGDLIPKEKPVDVVAELGPPPDIDPNNPPPPPPPPPPTPPPPTRSTVKFVPPVIKKDEEVQEEEQKAVDEILDKKEDIGTEDKKGNDEAPPTVDEAPSLDPVIEAPKVEEKTYEMFDIQKEPSFPGGQQEMYKWLAKNVEYPEMAKEAGISGQAVVTFVVGKDGSIRDVAIVKDPGGGCGKAVKTTVEKMPKWSPGEANGHPVKVRYTLPFKFKLE
jgi:protein TonB